MLARPTPLDRRGVDGGQWAAEQPEVYYCFMNGESECCCQRFTE